MNILGCDNSMTATGLCLVAWPRPKPIWYHTVIPPVGQNHIVEADCKAAVDDMFSEIGGLLDLLVVEGAFFSEKSPEACAEVATAGGLFRGMIGHVLPDIRVFSLKAVAWKKNRGEKGWREIVLRSSPYDKAACIEECEMLARLAGVGDATPHVYEAFGLACAGGTLIDKEAVFSR